MAIRPLKRGGTRLPRDFQADTDRVAAAGLDIEDLGTHLIYRQSSHLALEDPVKGTQTLTSLLDAENEDFDPTGSGLTSLKTGPAIRELYTKLQSVAGGTIYPIRAEYNGNSGTGTYLGTWTAGATDTDPEPIPTDSELILAYLRTNNTTGSFSVGVFEFGDLVTPLQTLTLTAGQNTNTFNISQMMSAGEQLAFRVTSGSRQKPKLIIFNNTAVL